MTSPLSPSFADNPLIDTFVREEVYGLGTSDSGHSWETTGGGTPIGRTNLITNPSLEVDTTGWTPSSGTFARSSASSYVGTYSGLFTVTSGAAVPFINSGFIPVTPGLSYTAQAQVKITSGGSKSIRVGRIYYNSSFVSILNLNSTAPTSVVTSSDWVQLSYTHTAPAGAAYVRTFLSPSVAATVGDAWYIDAYMLEQSSAVGTYFDGTSVGAEWTGTAHASTSFFVEGSSDGSGFSVDGTNAVVSTLPSGNYQALIAADESNDRNTDMTMTFTVPVGPVGDPLYLHLINRYSGSDYSVGGYRMNADGTGSVVLYYNTGAVVYVAGPSWTGQTVINVRFWHHDQDGRVKVWFGDAAEPDNWTHRQVLESINTSGQAGFAVVAGSTISNTPLNVYVKSAHFSSAFLQQNVYDTFSRDQSGMFGNAESGHEWGEIDDVLDPRLAVSASTGLATVTFTNTATESIIIPIGDEFIDVEGLMTFKLANAGSDGVFRTGIHLRYIDSQTLIYAAARFNTTTLTYRIELREFNNDPTPVITTVELGAFTLGVDYTLRAQVVGQTVRIKLWLTSGLEPDEWQLVVTTPVPALPSPVAYRVAHDAITGTANATFSTTSYYATDITLGVGAAVNDELDSPGVDLLITNGNMYETIRLERIHLTNVYETEPVRGLVSTAIPSSVYAERDYEMPLDESVLYKAYGIDGDGNVIAYGQSEPVKVEVPYHRAIVRSVGSPSLSRRIQVTEFREFSQELRVIQEAKVLGVRDPVITFDVMEGMTGTFTCMNILDQEAAGLALRELFRDGQPLMFQSVMRNTAIEDFYFLAVRISPSRIGAIGNESPPRFVYQVEFREIARPPAEVVADSFLTWQTLVDAGHIDWNSVDATHTDWLSVQMNTDTPPV